MRERATAQPGEHAATLHEIVVTATLDDATGVQHVDAVDDADGPQPVGDPANVKSGVQVLNQAAA